MAIKQTLRSQFTQYLKDNPDVYEPIKAAFASLDRGDTPMQVEDSLHDFTLTPHQTGLITTAITDFHERGTEFRTYWNKRHNVDLSSGITNDEVTYGAEITQRKA